MIRLEIKKNYHSILAEQQQKQQHYPQEKTDTYKFLTGKEILPSDQSRIIKQAEFTCSPLSKVFEKQIKTVENQEIKQVEALKALKSEENKELESIEGLFPKKTRTNEIKNEIDEIKKWKHKIK